MPAGIPVRPRPGVFSRHAGAGDDRLVAGVRRGDERCFELIYERYHRRLLSFCLHMLGTREEAEDALQQVFVSAHRQLLADERAVELRPWLYAIARNRCLSVLRARRQTVALEDAPGVDGLGLSVSAEVEQREELKDILFDIARLPEDQRAALLLSELEDLTHEQIAATLDVRREKVKALVFQARESLMGYRQAREADCEPIREQLATLRGSALRRGDLRRHLEVCAGCAQFKDEVGRQRAMVAAVLPVIPALGLRERILEAVHATGDVAAGVATAGGGAAAAGIATGGGAGSGTAAVGAAGVGSAGTGSVAGTGAAAVVSKLASSGVAAKALAVAALAASAGGGVVVVHESGGAASRPARAVGRTTTAVKPVNRTTPPAAPPARPAVAAGKAAPSTAVAKAAASTSTAPPVASRAVNAQAKRTAASTVTKTHEVKAPDEARSHSTSSSSNSAKAGKPAKTRKAAKSPKVVKAPKAAEAPKTKNVVTPARSGESAKPPKPQKTPKADSAEEAPTQSGTDAAKASGEKTKPPK